MRVKDYLSFSQYSCFLSSPAQYVKTYLEGKKMESKYLTFGGQFAEFLEKGTTGDIERDIKFKDLSFKLPPVKEREKEFLVDFEGIPLLGKLDGFSLKEGLAVIDEYKTGKHPWTQNKVDSHEQLTFYAIMVWKKLGIPLEQIYIRLHWLETCEDLDGSIFLTGRVEHFQTMRTMSDIIKIYPKIKKAWVGIEKLVDNYLAQ